MVATSAPAVPSSAAGWSDQPPLDELEPQAREHRLCRAAADDLEPPGQHRSCRDHGDEQEELRLQVVERCAAEAAGGDRRDQDGLGEDEQSRGDPERGVGGERDARGPRATEKARVEQPHRF